MGSPELSTGDRPRHLKVRCIMIVVVGRRLTKWGLLATILGVAVLVPSFVALLLTLLAVLRDLA